MRPLTPVIVGLGAFAAAAIAQTATAPIEPKAGANAQSNDQAGPADNGANANTATPPRETAPANTVAPVEPKR